MHFRPAAFAFLLAFAGCSKTDQSQTAAPPAVPPPVAPKAGAGPKAEPKVAAKAVEASAPVTPSAPAPVTVPASALAQELPATTSKEMRGAPSSKSVPAPVAPVIAIAQPEHPAVRNGRPTAVDDSGVERIALMPGSRVSAPPTPPSARPHITAPSLEATDMAPDNLAGLPSESSKVSAAPVPAIVAPPASAAAPDVHPAEVSPQILMAPSFNGPAVSGRRTASTEPAEPNVPAAVKKGPQSLPVFSIADPSRSITSLNELIVDSIKMVPPGGDYKADQATIDLLRNAITISDKRLSVIPDFARPSFCSEATYLVFLVAVERLQGANRLPLSEAAMNALLVHRQRDGEGVWGRWNANGPGTARLFHELGAGHSFTNPLSAQAGDFLKIWWNDEIGCHERGHSVVFLGMVQTETGEVAIRYWSSNKIGGYGEGVAPVTKVKRMLFSRLENPAALLNAPRLPATDKYLADMLKRPSTQEEMMQMCGVE